jgi:hypothetical protein
MVLGTFNEGKICQIVLVGVVMVFINKFLAEDEGCKSDTKKEGCCGNECEGCCGNECECGLKFKTAMQKAIDNDGLHCNMCNTFCRYAQPNRCDGAFYCHKCKTDYSWKIPKKGKWV